MIKDEEEQERGQGDTGISVLKPLNSGFDFAEKTVCTTFRSLTLLIFGLGSEQNIHCVTGLGHWQSQMSE